MPRNLSTADVSSNLVSPTRGFRYFGNVLGLLGLFALVSAPISLAFASDNRVVRVGVYQNSPKIFLSDHRISGIFGDLIYNIADREGWTVVPVPCQWQQCLAMVRSGKIDLMPDVAYTDARAQHMVFGKVPALYSWSELYRRPHTVLRTIKDLAGKRIAVLSESVQEAYLRDMLGNFGVNNVKLVPVPSYAKAFELTTQGKTFAVAANYFYGDAAALKYHLRSTPVIFEPAQLYFVIPKGHDTTVLAAIDSYLSSWEADPDSAYYKILGRWRIEKPVARIPPDLWWGMGILTALLVIAVVLTALLRRRVIKQSYDLEISERKLGDILNSVNAYIYIKDMESRYQYVNQHISELYGVPSREIIGQRNDIFFDDETSERVRTDDQRVLRDGETITQEDVTHGKDGKTRHLITVKQPLRDSNGEIYALFGISTDITESRHNEEKIHRLAYYDPLTELANRVLLLDRMQHALDNHARTRSEGALLFLDLDNFKVLNDTLGHIKGDLLLQQVAERLRRHVRRNDTLARLGGDEFVILMDDLGEVYEDVLGILLTVGNKLLHGLADEPFQLEDLAYNITASIGVSVFSDAAVGQNELTQGTLLKQADMAMYAAKSAGRNNVKFFNPAMQATLAERAELEKEIREAIQTEKFQLAYQPVVDGNARVVAAEVLARWYHPEKGNVPPAQFIPCAESSGQIIPLGKWILRKACHQLAVFQSDNARADMVLAVNVSARQFYHPDFVSDVIDALEGAGAKPQGLELELTESLMADDVETLIERMTALKDYGVQFSLDDFGTGYSSLSYLKRLPLDHLKIDQTFVRDLLVDPNDAAIIRTIIALGDTLDLSIIAEGVETTEQRDVLLSMGCQRLQGYLFGYPDTPDKL